MNSKPITELLDCWDKLTPSQQQALIHRARYFVGYNMTAGAAKAPAGQTGRMSLDVKKDKRLPL